MNTNDVIESYVHDVMRRLPGKDRNDIGLELRELLGEMLADRGATAGQGADDATVLAMLREFGTPAAVAARYRPPGTVIIPADQTRRFAVWSLVGIALQWALTLPRVFEGQPIVAWWLSWGLGALWWPGFLAMMALAAAGVRELGLAGSTWRPRSIDSERISRGAVAVSLAGAIIGMAIVIGLPWITRLLPDPMPRVFAFDNDFLGGRAWPVLLLFLDNLVILVAVFIQGRWTPRLRRIALASNVLWIALLVWWLAAGSIFVARPTDDGAKAGIALVLLFIVADFAWKLYRSRVRIRVPKPVGQEALNESKAP